MGRSGTLYRTARMLPLPRAAKQRRAQGAITSTWFVVVLVRTECPAWCSGGRRPLIAGCLSLWRLGVDLPATRPVWDLNLGPPASESPSLANCAFGATHHHVHFWGTYLGTFGDDAGHNAQAARGNRLTNTPWGRSLAAFAGDRNKQLMSTRSRDRLLVICYFHISFFALVLFSVVLCDCLLVPVDGVGAEVLVRQPLERHEELLLQA